MTDTRKDKRAPISLKVRFKSATVDEFIEQYSKDISKGGIFIKSNKNSPPMPIGTLLKFEFQLKDESKLIQGVGRVVWKRELEGSSDNDPAGMGIKFIKMDGESKTLVDQIVAGRGEAPGQFEAGGGGVGGREEADAGAAPAATTASGEGKRPIRSQKATMQFFPSTTPQNELPKPEDRTQVRHASEFLASALSSAGVDDATAGEADKKAEEARQRSAEIEREREDQARKAREEEDKKARAEKERHEREKAEAEEKAAAAEKAEAEKAAKAKAADEKAAAGAADTVEAPKKKATSERPPADKAEKKDDKKAAAAATPAKKAEPKAAVVEAPPPAPASSNMMPIFAAVLVVVALGGWYLFGRGDTSGTSTDLPPPPPSTAVDVPPPPTDVEPPPETTVDDGTGEPTTDEGTGEPTTDEGTGEPTTDVPPPPDAVTHDIRFDSTPAGATIVVDGQERGAAPQTVTLTEGEHALEVRAAGYRTATQTVSSAAGMRPVRVTLTALPWIIHVTTTPPGARVRIGSRTVTAPGDATVGRVTSPLIATASLAGHLDATQRVEASAFTQTDDAMSADLAITLTPRPAAPPPTTTVRRPPPTTTTTTTTAETPPATEAHDTPPATEAHHETAPPPATEAPPPATEAHHETAPPPATEAPPDNPF